MHQSSRLIINTVATYARMLVSFGLGLVATRLLLQTMGTTDFGIFALFGSGLSLLNLLNEALAASAQRQMAFDIALSKRQELAAAFNTTLVMFLGLGVVICVIAESSAPFVLSVLKIPDTRLNAAWWAYQAMTINVLLAIATAPFIAMIQSHQAMILRGALWTLYSFFLFLAAIVLPWMSGDSLVLYSQLFVIAGCISAALTVATCTLRFPESRPSMKLVSGRLLMPLASFAGWSTLVLIAWRLTLQGASIVLNIFFGPVINAAYGIATNVATYYSSLTGAVLRASHPVMTGLHARRETEAVRQFAVTVDKLSTFTTLVLVVPALVEIEVVLRIWLGTVPPQTDLFVSMMLLSLTVDNLASGHSTAIMAQEHIGRYSITIVMFQLLILPLATGAMIFGVGPQAISYTMFVVFILLVPIRVWITGRYIGASVCGWFRGVFQPVCLCTLAATAAALPAHYYLPEGPLRLTCVFTMFSGVMLPAAWRIGLTSVERNRVASAITSFLTRRSNAKELVPQITLSRPASGESQSQSKIAIEDLAGTDSRALL